MSSLHEQILADHAAEQLKAAALSAADIPDFAAQELRRERAYAAWYKHILDKCLIVARECASAAGVPFAADDPVLLILNDIKDVLERSQLSCRTCGMDLEGCNCQPEPEHRSPCPRTGPGSNCGECARCRAEFRRGLKGDE